MPLIDPRFAAFEDPEFAEDSVGESSRLPPHDEDENHGSLASSEEGAASQSEEEEEGDEEGGLGEGMVPDGFAGPSEKTVKPLTPEALAAFKAAQEKAGVLYISRIPPGMRPTKVRHLMSGYGAVGRVYLQQEGAFFCFMLPRPAADSVRFDTNYVCRCQTCVLAPKIHRDEEGTLHRGLGRVQGQAHSKVRCGDAECPTHWGQEGHEVEGRRLDDEVLAQV